MDVEEGAPVLACFEPLHALVLLLAIETVERLLACRCVSKKLHILSEAGHSPTAAEQFTPLCCGPAPLHVCPPPSISTNSIDTRAGWARGPLHGPYSKSLASRSVTLGAARLKTRAQRCSVVHEVSEVGTEVKAVPEWPQPVPPTNGMLVSFVPCTSSTDSGVVELQWKGAGGSVPSTGATAARSGLNDASQPSRCVMIAPSLMPVENTAVESMHSSVERDSTSSRKNRTSSTPVLAMTPQQPPPAFQLELTLTTPVP